MLRKLLTASVLMLFLGLASMPALADGIPIQNASFETAALPLTTPCGTGCSYNFGPIPGWTISGTAGLFQPGSFFNPGQVDGNIAAFTNTGAITQILGTSLATDTIYTLSVFIGDRNDGLNGNYIIALDAGSTPLCSFGDSSAKIKKGTFVDETCTFQSGSIFPSGLLKIVLTGTSGQVDFDNVSLTSTPVPEPSSAALTGLGLLLTLLMVACIKRKQFPLAFRPSRSTIS
jgi:hypothetical protein